MSPRPGSYENVFLSVAHIDGCVVVINSYGHLILLRFYTVGLKTTCMLGQQSCLDPSLNPAQGYDIDRLKLEINCLKEGLTLQVKPSVWGFVFW